MDIIDDELVGFAAHEEPVLPERGEGFVGHDGARIWFATWGEGPAVMLLHGGLGHSGNFGYQVPALLAAGYRVAVIDSRGHGRSTRDARPMSYATMAGDVRAVMDRLGIDRAAIVGWSDGADSGLVLAKQTPERVRGLFFFACNVDPSGTLPFKATPALERCFGRHVADYAALSPTPDGFQKLQDDLGPMQASQPNYSAADLASIRVPVTVALGEHDEFIRPEHADYMAATIPGARRVTLPGVSHFAPLQRPALFNRAVLEFLGGLDG